MFLFLFFIFIFIFDGMVATDAGVAQLNSRKARQATHTQHIFFFFLFYRLTGRN